jgi:hypothetical protein
MKELIGRDLGCDAAGTTAADSAIRYGRGDP